MQVNPGELNKKITILDAEENEIRKCWSSVRNTTGKEVAGRNTQFEEATTRFLVRYTSTLITNDCSIDYNGYLYDIQYVNNYNEANEYIEIIAIKRSWSTTL